MPMLSRLFRRPAKRSEGWDLGAAETRMVALCGSSLNQIRLETYTFAPRGTPVRPGGKANRRTTRRSVALPAAQSIMEILPFRPSENPLHTGQTGTEHRTQAADYTEFHLAGLGLPDNIVHDHHLFAARHTDSSALLIAAARAEAATAQLEQAAALGLKADYLDIDILALANAFLFGSQPAADGCRILLRLEPESIQMLAFDNGRVCHIQETLLPPAADSPDSENRHPAFQTASTDAVCREAQHLLQLYRHTRNPAAIPDITLTGTLASAVENGLAAAGLPARCRHPIHALDPDIAEADAARLSTAFGLALKPFIASAAGSESAGR
ncbi:hypothetical protein V9W64_02965 [Neisseria leonii]|uniref:Pilus assembly protein PilM n=1 Tax=Neisseria leonii TaxID=2995413 RepID=A0A9X4E3L0_9NEIS|nr:hypothetical protein [Neisseria sp. 51.81]MDD9327331.1 hypothetical protein [Neisseria sp. 51.81]